MKTVAINLQLLCGQFGTVRGGSKDLYVSAIINRCGDNQPMLNLECRLHVEPRNSASADLPRLTTRANAKKG
eukprot:SAG31_NODE_1142_length_9696_cov_3.874232_16_plen_72_part_00